LEGVNQNAIILFIGMPKRKGLPTREKAEKEGGAEE